jgi:hypothetical protein
VVQDALDVPLAGVRNHIAAALAALSKRPAPDVRTSIKESISAVEAIVSAVAGQPGASLGDALKTLQHKHPNLAHKALAGAFSKIYGWTSEVDGIRHAMLDDPTVDTVDARFMLVACSAFVHYLAQKAYAAGIPLVGT